MNEDEKMDEDEEMDEEDSDDPEAKAEFEAIFGDDEDAIEISIEELIAPGSAISKIYYECLKLFNYAECLNCEERFHSKIAFVCHMIQVHQISPNEIIKRGDVRLSEMKMTQNVDSIEKSKFDSNWGPVKRQQIEKSKLIFTLIPNDKDFKIDQNDQVVINKDKFDNILVSTDYEIDSDPPSSTIPPKNRKRSREVMHGFDLVLTESNDSDLEKFDDIPVSTKGENIKDSGFDSCCQETLGKHDDITVSSKDISASDSDPPCPILKPRGTDRIEEEEDDFGWMVFPDGRRKKRKFPDPRHAPEITDKELENDHEYQQLISECSSET